MTAKVLGPPSDAQALIRTAQALIRTAAFRLLLVQEHPISVGDLVGVTGVRRDKLCKHLDELDRVRRIRRDEAGRVVGSADLRVTKDRHEIELDGRRLWAWCAYAPGASSERSRPAAARSRPARAAGRSRFSSTAAIR